jgi:CRISPR-associated protein Csd1
MILQRLVDYYDRLASDPSDPMTPQGFSREKISFALVIEPDGSAATLSDLREQAGKKLFPRIMAVPDRGGRSGTALKPNFLWDNSGYVLGHDGKGKPDRSRQAFEAFRDFHVQMSESIDDPELAIVSIFLRGWSPEKAVSLELFEDVTDKNIVFRIRGTSHFVHESPAILTQWKAPIPDDAPVVVGQSLIGGDFGPIARLHPLISGVKDAQTMGAAIASFNLDAFTSYGLEQTYNAPVSLPDAFKYTTALNRLLENRNRRMQLGGATVVFWAERPTLLEEVINPFLSESPTPADDAPAEDQERARQVRQFLSQLRDGHAGSDVIDADTEVKFYILGLSPNASRLSIRFWVQTTVGEMQQRLRQHLSDVELVGAREADPPLVLRRIVQATGRAEFSGGSFKGYDTDAVPPLLSGALARAVFGGTMYPQMLLGAMLNRLRADGYISHPRIATIKACIVRNKRLKGQQKEILVALDTSRTDCAYVTGRLFAVLERIQSDAMPDLNATIKDRYFGAASATPGVVFPRLIRLSQHHLSNLGKEKRGLKVNHDKLCGEIMSKLDGFQSHFNLEEQGLFAVGYYHQRQDFYTAKPKAEGNEL